MDQMIYEKRMETWSTSAGLSFYDRRGWGESAPNDGAHHQGLVKPLRGVEVDVFDRGLLAEIGLAKTGVEAPVLVLGHFFTPKYASGYSANGWLSRCPQRVVSLDRVRRQQ